MSVMDSLYETRESDVLCPEYDAPEKFERRGEHVVVRIPKDDADGDGQPCEIVERRAPARFYTLRVLEDVNSVGDTQPAWEMTTGSGSEMGRLLVSLARAVAEGMIGIKVDR